VDRSEVQVAVVGAGAAGLYTAIRAAREGVGVTLISATALAGSSTYWAQGGLAAALAPDDTPERHVNDTILAGRGAVRESAARVLCQEAPQAVEDVLALGMEFDRDDHGELALGLEGGHSARRIVHAGGAATGQRLIERLSTVAASDPGIDVREGRRATALLVADGQCQGVLLDDGHQIAAGATVLATGGAAALWARTTNPPGAVGGGLLLASGAGATLADLELVQFHPTAVASANGADGFLVTEAVRGEGARLLDAGGERFVDELAPRDEVARAIEQQMALSGRPSVSLDMREVDPGLFPNVVRALRQVGIDPVRELVPVAPAAHYMMGGIATNLDARSTLPRLYAVGECSCTGVHGANRLASNSLTECFVFGARAARSAAADAREVGAGGRAVGADGRAVGAGGLASSHGAAASGGFALSLDSRRALWENAGLERDAASLERLTGDEHPLVRLIGRSALAREESRGAHQRRDFPDLDHRLDGRHVVIEGGGSLALELWR
jgi:L-aspartate oxidase